MILLDQNSTAIYEDALGLDEEKAWGRDWIDHAFNNLTATLVDVALPVGFKGGQFGLVEGALVPNAAYAPDLVGLRAAKDAEINAARLAANRVSFDHSGKTFACDLLSRSDIDGVNGWVCLTQSLPPDFPGGWKAVDNTYIAIADVTAWTAFYGAMVAKGNANFVKAQMLKAQNAAASTPEQIGAIKW